MGCNSHGLPLAINHHGITALRRSAICHASRDECLSKARRQMDSATAQQNHFQHAREEQRREGKRIEINGVNVPIAVVLTPWVPSR